MRGCQDFLAGKVFGDMDWDWESVHLDSSLMRDWVKIASNYLKIQLVEGIGFNISGFLCDTIFTYM